MPKKKTTKTKKVANKKPAKAKSKVKIAKKPQKPKKTKPVKKAAKAKQNKLSVVTAPPEFCFWLCDGTILKDLKELKKALSTMTDEVFAYHVGKDKNDFSAWVKEVLYDEGLAKKMLKLKGRKATLKAVEERLKKNYK